MPAEVEKLVRERAQTRGVSANQAVLSLLRERAGVSSTGLRNVQHTDLDDLAGAWSKKEGLEFERKLSQRRKVDDELW